MSVSKQPNEAFLSFVKDDRYMSPHNSEVQDAWNGALDTAAKLLMEWTEGWDKSDHRAALNEFGQQMYDAQRSNQKSCVDAILSLKYFPKP